MNSTDNDNLRIASAVSRLETWFASMEGADGYHGPVVGLRTQLLGWCGAGNDWRWEGLLDGWRERHRLTGDPAYLAHMNLALERLQQAQLADGTLRNSYFDQNPCEGGMPYEPAVMAAVLRTVAYLRQQGQEPSPGALGMLDAFVEKRLIKELWNKNLQTFNNWLQSDFESYAPPAVAAVVDVLAGYGALTGRAERWQHYLAGAGESLLAAQLGSGPLQGAMPVSNSAAASVSPFLAARCLPALRCLASLTGDPRYATARERLQRFVAGALQPGGGIAFMQHRQRPASVAPLFVGATAHVLRLLQEDGATFDMTSQIDWVLQHQSASGAFETSVGFGGRGMPPRLPDWRDLLPVVAWNAFCYAMLAPRAGAAGANTSVAAPAPVDRLVQVKSAKGRLLEDAGQIVLEVGGSPLFRWTKRTLAPDVCLI